MSLPVRPQSVPGEANWTPVASSWLAAIAFKPLPGSTYGSLLIETKDGKRYMYANVPRFVWMQMREPSHGQAWWRLRLKDYPVTRIA